jgi:hypothetical protein
MQITKYLMSLTSLSGDALFGLNGSGKEALVRVEADASGKHTITLWNVPNIPKPTDDDLATALTAPDPAPSKDALTTYATKVWDAVLAKGETFNVAASGAAVNVLSDGTNSTRADLALLALYGQANPTGTKSWIDNNGVVTALSGTELVTLATLVGNWISDTYPALQTLLGQIGAATVTTTAQIDAYQWPTS